MRDFQDARNLPKLASAPDYHGLQLIPVGPAEIFGGRRSLDGTTIPEGWKQMPWDPLKRVLGLPARCYDYDPAAVLSTADGTRHIIEVEFEYYLWFEPEQIVSRIEAPRVWRGYFEPYNQACCSISGIHSHAAFQKRPVPTHSGDIDPAQSDTIHPTHSDNVS